MSQRNKIKWLLLKGHELAIIQFRKGKVAEAMETLHRLRRYQQMYHA